MTPAFLACPVLLLALAACEPIPTAADPVPDTPDTCGATAAAETFVGQDESVIFATLFTAPIRVIRPGDMVTMDFNPERLNFAVGPDGRILQVTCG